MINQGMYKSLTAQNGFTFIEVLIVMIILVVILTVSMPIYYKLQFSNQLSESAQETAQTLRLAREYSMSSYDNSAYGVYFNIASSSINSVVLYQGDSYSSRDEQSDEIYSISSPLSASSTLAGNEVNFSQASGTPSTTGSLILSDQSGGQKIITINSYGMVDLE